MKELTKEEQFTKEVSPTNEGIRATLKKEGLLKHVHEWMKRYSDQNTKPLIDEIAELKENYNHYVDKCFKLEDEITKLKASKSEANEAVIDDKRLLTLLETLHFHGYLDCDITKIKDLTQYY